ncbi:unnamed protein product, partial [Effrenium voratum]
MPAAEDDQKYFENSAKCRSPFLRARYKVCGAPLHGQLDDQPRKFELNPRTGQLEQAITFEVWPKNPGGWDLNSAPHKVDIRFVGVDSPIAWAARREGCSTLENASAAVAASADAACHLLRNYTDPCRPLCQLMDEQSFGGQWHGDFLAPLLSERGLAQAMSCHLEACRENYFTWSFRDGIFFLGGRSARASSKAILEVASKPGGLEFVKNLHQGFKAKAEEGEKAKRTYEEVLRSFATEVWTIPFDAATVEALANFSETMPKLLLKYWVTSRGALPENVTEFRTLQAAFDPVTHLRLSLTDPAQLERVAAAVPNNPIQALPKEVFQHITKLEKLGLENNQIKTLPKEVFQNLIKLEKLDLSFNQIQTLPKEVFQHLTKLETLYLSYNQIQTLPKEIFNNLKSLKELDLDRNQPGLERPAVCEKSE